MKYEDRFMSAEARRIYIGGLRRMSGAQKLRMIAEMWETAKALARAGVRQQHPEFDSHAVQEEMRRRFLRWNS